jgi:hypothetical protein
MELLNLARDLPPGTLRQDWEVTLTGQLQFSAQLSASIGVLGLQDDVTQDHHGVPLDAVMSVLYKAYWERKELITNLGTLKTSVVVSTA